MEIPGFKIERLIGEGGMASVYLAMQESLDRLVALKVLKKFDSPLQAKRFLYEGRIIASLNHRNIITIYDIGAIGDQYYIVMEYLERGSLADRIAAGMQPQDILDLMENIAGCLDFIHRKGIIHRDIKPGNILFHKDGTVKLTDFGIAKQIDDDQNLTMDGSTFGSPYYLSPEQAAGHPLDARSDIYGLGIVFYEMLTGRKPYVQDSHIETILSHLTHPIPIFPDELSGYQKLLECMIAKNPNDRVASAQHLLELIGNLRHSLPKSRKGVEEIRESGLRLNWLRRFVTNRFDQWRILSLTLKSALVLFLSLSIAIAIFLFGNQIDYREIGAETMPGSLSSDAVEKWTQVTAGKYRASAIDKKPNDERSPSSTSSQPKATDESRPSQAPLGTDRIHVLEASTQEVLPVTESGVQPFESSESVAPSIESESQVAFAKEKALPQEPTAGLATESPVDPTPTIEYWLRAADRSLENFRLTTPPNNNAYSYYQKVLSIDPGNKEASRGIEKIAEHYVLLARGKLDEGKYRQAQIYVQRGMQVLPQHAGLLALHTKLESRSVARRPVARRTDEWPWETRPENTGTGNIVKDFKNLWNDLFIESATRK